MCHLGVTSNNKVANKFCVLIFPVDTKESTVEIAYHMTHSLREIGNKPGRVMPYVNLTFSRNIWIDYLSEIFCFLIYSCISNPCTLHRDGRGPVS